VVALVGMVVAPVVVVMVVLVALVMNKISYISTLLSIANLRRSNSCTGSSSDNSNRMESCSWDHLLEEVE
jgi:hypothetical protein